MAPIALITDLGNKDYFVGSMKGEILSINPDAKIVDITHKVPKHDVFTASFILANASETFPENTVFVAVVDPGVGTERKCILLRTENGFDFIGPDNGVFTAVADKYRIKEVREISNKHLMRSKVSYTFHGRDLMAPVAAYISKDPQRTKVGPKIERMETLEIEEPKISESQISGKILHIDNFGNLITNIPEKLIKEFFETKETIKIELGEKEIEAPFLESFGNVAKGEILCYIGSADTLEIAKNQGNLASDLKTKKESDFSIKLQ